VAIFSKKKRIDSVNGRTPLPSWMMHSDRLMESVLPSERIFRLLKDIQKRVLAEQVLILSWMPGREKPSLMGMSPAGEAPLFDSSTQKLIIEKLAQTRVPLTDKNYSFQTEQEKEIFDSFMAVPLTVSEDSVDALVLINYSRLNETRFTDYLGFITSVLSLALQNGRLFGKLKKKQEELHQWVTHVEERIEQGTRQLLEKELRYQVLFDGATDGIFVHDEEGRILEVNRAACSLLKVDKKTLLNTPWNQFIPADDWEEQNAYFKKVLSTKKALPLKAAMLRADGQSFHAEIRCRRVRIGGRYLLQTFVRDISPQVTLQASLQESKEKYRIFIESSLVGVFIVRKNRIQFANGMFERMTGFAKNELLGRNFLDLVASEDREEISKKLNNESGSEQYETRFITRSGAELWGEVYSHRVILDGRVSVLGNVVDITQRKKLESRMFETQKLESIGTLAGGIAHDFNNLLGGILGYASLLLSDIDENHPFYSDLQTIASTTKKAAELTNHLLAFARGGKYRVTTLSVNQIVHEVIKALTHATDRTIAVETMLDDNLWTVRGDYEQIYQVIYNIGINAAQAMPNGGVIQINTSNFQMEKTFSRQQLGITPGNYVRVTVTDTGAGMDEKTLTRAFEPFFTTRPAGQGTGMGLSVAYGVIRNHGGAIQLASEPGHGTKVTFFLPRSTEQRDEQLVVPNNKGQGTVLLVDDERIIRHVGKRMLEKGGYRVLLAADGQEALDIFKKEHQSVDLVIMDLIMPRMDGREAYQRLVEIDSKVKVLFTSGYRQDDRLELIPFNEIDFVQKPFNTDTLLRAVSNRMKFEKEDK